MGAAALARHGRGWEDAGRSGRGARGASEAERPAQPRLFALPGGALEEPMAAAASPAAPERIAPPEPAPVPVPVAPVPVRTLEDELADVWAALAAGTTAACPVCAGPMRPRWTAGAGVAGGRCADCGTLMD